MHGLAITIPPIMPDDTAATRLRALAPLGAGALSASSPPSRPEQSSEESQSETRSGRRQSPLNVPNGDPFRVPCATTRQSLDFSLPICKMESSLWFSCLKPRISLHHLAGAELGCSGCAPRCLTKSPLQVLLCVIVSLSFKP